MEKTSNKEHVAARLKEKEVEINRHVEALQQEVLNTGADIKSYVAENPWIKVAGAVGAGLFIGWLFGKKSKKTQHRELVDDYINRLAQLARQSGADEHEVGLLLRDALRETMPPVIVSPPSQKAGGIGKMLMGLGANMAIGFAKKSLINILDERITPSGHSDLPGKVDSEE